MRKPRLLTALLLALTLLLGACDTLNSLLPDQPEPEDRIEMKYGLGLACYSSHFIHPELTTSHENALGLILKYAPTDPDITPPEDYTIPVLISDTRTGLLAHRNVGFHFRRDGSFTDEVGFIYTDKPATPGRDYRIQFDGNTHILTLPEDACLPQIETADITYEDQPDGQRQWTFTWPDVAPHLGYVNYAWTTASPAQRARTNTNSWSITTPNEPLTLTINAFTTPDDRLGHEHNWDLFDYGEFDYVYSETRYQIGTYTPED